MSKTKRKRFTEQQVLQTLWHQGVALVCFRCKTPILPVRLVPELKLYVPAQREHLQEVALGGPDIPANCRYSHTECHDKITNGTKATSAGSSKHRIAKVKRLQRKAAGTWKKTKRAWPRGRKLQSRPFEKRREQCSR